MEAILGLTVLLVVTGLILFFYFSGRRKRPARLFRDIPAYTRLKRAVGLAVESGSRLHISFGRGGLIGEQSAPALVGLSMLERITRAASVSDKPPLATAGDGAMAILAQDTLRSAYRLGSLESQYDPNSGRFIGPATLPYAAGTMPVIDEEQVSANILIGHFGSEVALINEAAERKGCLTIAGTDDLAGQSVLYATAEESLIGEEVFAGGAYLGAGPMHDASLRTQDILRLLVVAVVVIGAILKLFGLDTFIIQLIPGGLR